MPNLKIFVDQSLDRDTIAALQRSLPALRAMLCEALKVPISLAQLAIVPALGLSDQAQFAVEMQILPKAERTRGKIDETCARLRDMLQEIADVPVTIRVTMVDPQSYFVHR